MNDDLKLEFVGYLEKSYGWGNHPSLGNYIFGINGIAPCLKAQANKLLPKILLEN